MAKMPAHLIIYTGIFSVRNRDKLESNHRISMMYKIYERMGEDKKQAIADDSKHFLKVYI